MGNRMGPLGAGPGTGRGAGYCNGFKMPGTFNRGGRGGGFGRFGGRGFGYGAGAGFGAGFYPQQPPVNTESQLKAEAEFLEERLNFIKEQLNNQDNES